jgi:hypothetical protein
MVNLPTRASVPDDGEQSMMTAARRIIRRRPHGRVAAVDARVVGAVDGGPGPTHTRRRDSILLRIAVAFFTSSPYFAAPPAMRLLVAI